MPRNTIFLFWLVFNLHFPFPDIDECLSNNGGCHHNCTNEAGTYTCTCQAGYTLFTQDGINGNNIPGSETGLLEDDVLHIGHTCVSKFSQLQ